MTTEAPFKHSKITLKRTPLKLPLKRRVMTPLTSEIAFLSNSRWQNLKDRLNRSITVMWSTELNVPLSVSDTLVKERLSF